MQFAGAIALWAELPVEYIPCYILSFCDISDYHTLLFLYIYIYIFMQLYQLARATGELFPQLQTFVFLFVYFSGYIRQG